MPQKHISLQNWKTLFGQGTTPDNGVGVVMDDETLITELTKVKGIGELLRNPLCSITRDSKIASHTDGPAIADLSVC